jgi:hypothetical protein
MWNDTTAEERCMGMGASERAAVFLDRIESGAIPKRCLPNHGVNYTGGKEDIACMRFNRYIVSCGYRLMKKRIGTEARIYRG